MATNAHYTVQSGDTLYGIALKIYGDGEQFPLIQAANNLTNADHIVPGQTLMIPASNGATDTASVAEQSISGSEDTPDLSTATPASSTNSASDFSAPISGESYGTLPINGAPTDRPAAQHGDINLALRGYEPTEETVGLIDMSGPTDNRAPQLPGLFQDHRTPSFSSVHRVHQWIWESNSRGGVDAEYAVSVLGMETLAAETIHVPNAGYEIGQGNAVLVLYADRERITLKYTGEDSIVNGYAIHVENVHTEPSLLALYEQMNAQGRSHLPALRAGQALGRARGNEIRVVIRDTGRFMDPRVRKDWWRGR
ncbi:MAG: LysM peptidoglycan-binding domain-containing protein [Chloroflexota bacterium]